MSGIDHYGIPWRYATMIHPGGKVHTKLGNQREAPCTICKQWRNVKTGRRYTVTDGFDTKHFFCCGRCRSGKTIKEMAVQLRPWSE